MPIHPSLLIRRWQWRDLIFRRPALSWPRPSGIGAVQTLNRKMLGAIRARIKIGDLLHFILANDEGDEHLWVSGSLDRPLALILPMEGNPFTRLASAERFCRRLLGMAPGPPALRPPPFRRRWLAEAIELRDGGYIRLLRGG